MYDMITMFEIFVTFQCIHYTFCDSFPNNTDSGISLHDGKAHWRTARADHVVRTNYYTRSPQGTFASKLDMDFSFADASDWLKMTS